MIGGMDPVRAAVWAAAVGCWLTWWSVASAQAPPQLNGRGMAAITHAAESGKYLFLFFWKDDDSATRTAYGVFQSGLQSMDGTVESSAVRVTDQAERAVVDRFGLDRAPLPLVLAVAPNGAVTRAFPPPLTNVDWRDAFVSPAMARCLKALQERKLVVLCVGNERMAQMPAVLRGAGDFRADPRFASATEVVVVNPGDQAEATLLRDLQVDPRGVQPTTILLAPPGRPIARFTGTVSSDQLAAKVASAQSDCCPGGTCGPGGCKPQR